MDAILCKPNYPITYLRSLPQSLVFEEVASPEPGPGEAVISVKAASVNFPDVLIIENKYQLKPPLPFSPGSELAGVVKAVGDGVTACKPGDRVMAITGYGAFAEEVKTDARRALAIPAGMDFATAAAFGLTYATSEFALVDRGALTAGETLLVLGAAGGVGLAAIEIGKILGARVIACASTDDKLAVCREHGADETINYATEVCASASRRSPAATAPTSSTIRSAGRTPSSRCARSPGAGGSSSSVSRRARFRKSR